MLVFSLYVLNCVWQFGKRVAKTGGEGGQEGELLLGHLLAPVRPGLKPSLACFVANAAATFACSASSPLSLASSHFFPLHSFPITSLQARAAAKAAAQAAAAKSSSASLASEGQKSSKKAEQEAKRVGGLVG